MVPLMNGSAIPFAAGGGILFSSDPDNRKTQLGLYYLFMLADGEESAPEMEKYEALRKALGVSEEDSLAIIERFEKIADGPGTDCSQRVLDEMSKILDENESSWNSLKRNKKTQTTVIWNLINLGYADTEYSDPEKKVVAYLIEHWDFDREKAAVMIDTADTMLALEKQKKWCKSIGMGFDQTTEYIRRLDERMAYLANCVDLMISESE